MRFWYGQAGLAWLAVIGAPLARAQTVRGQLVDRGNGFPVAGGFVVLLDEAGTEVARALTGVGGTFLIQAPAAGTFRLQSKRIGFRSSISPPLVLADSQTVGFRLEVEAVPATLPPVIVEGRPQCGTRGDAGTAVAQLWDEAREALAAVKWTEGQTAHRYTVERFDREFAALGQRVVSEHRSTWSGTGETPFRSVPAEELEQRGYVVIGPRDTVDYYAPDAAVLLGDIFVNSHCFNARDGGSEHPGLVGIAFEPAPKRTLPDVEGVLWIERKTLELRTLEFTYTQLPGSLPEGALGGEVNFVRLPNGVWIVREWHIRMAKMGRIVYRGTSREPESKVLGFRESGGEVITMSSGAGTVIYSADESILEGEVVDSSRNGVPLRGAVVSLTGTNHQTSTDERGHFQIIASVGGEYGLAFRHPRLDSMGVVLEPVPVRLVRGARVIRTLAVPPEERLLEQLCPRGLRAEQRVVVGHVRRPDGTGIAGARVQMAWQQIGRLDSVATSEQTLATETDSSGAYVLCGAPSDRVRVRASHADAAGREVVLSFSKSGVWIDNKQYRSLAGRIWLQELVISR